jgi:phosphonate transport system substrate-binding protein
MRRDNARSAVTGTATPGYRTLRHRFALLAGLLCIACAGPAGAQPMDDLQGPEHLVFGFLPIVSPERLARQFSPLVDYLSRALETEIRMETAPNFAEFIRRTNQEHRYDLLFTAPHLFYLAGREQGYQAVARVAEPGMKAVIVVPRSSSIQALKDLRGQRLATTDRLALATVLIRSTLVQAGIDPDRDLTLVATPSHNASLLSSHQGTTDASGLMLPLFQRSRAEIRDAMKIIAETRSVPHMPIAVAPWVPAARVTRLRAVLLDMADDDQGSTVLRGLGWPGFAPTRAGDYDDVGRMAEQAGIEAPQ